MLKKIKNYKLILFILLFFIIVLSLNHNSYVYATFDFSNVGVDYSVPDLPLNNSYLSSKYYIITYNESSNIYRFFVSSKPINVYLYDYNSDGITDVLFNSTYSVNETRSCKDGISWQYDSFSTTVLNVNGKNQQFGTNLGEVIFSNHDILYIGSNDVFYYSANNDYATFNFNLSYEHNEIYNNYTIYSDWYSNFTDNYMIEGFFSISYQNSFDINNYLKQGWSNMKIETYTDLNYNISNYRFTDVIIDYGTYYYCLYDYNSDTYKIIVLDFNEENPSISFDKHTIYFEYSNNNSFATIYSNYFKYNDKYTYNVLFSRSEPILNNSSENNDWEYENNMLIDSNDNYYRFYKDIYNNQTYWLKINTYNPDNNGELINSEYFEITIDGIEKIYLDESSLLFGNEFQTADVFITPYIDYSTSTIYLRTQYLSSDLISRYYCYYDIDGNGEEHYSNPDNYFVVPEFKSDYHNPTTGKDDIYWQIPLSFDTPSQKYYFVFWDFKLECWGNITEYYYNSETIWDIAIDLNDFNNPKLNEIKDFFINRFGFLTYPFEFIVDVSQRFFSINFDSEPILRIPQLKDPVNNIIIMESITFNFNDLLQNNIFNTLHNIYLIAVDFILIVGFIFLLKKTIERVWGS